MAAGFRFLNFGTFGALGHNAVWWETKDAGLHTKRMLFLEGNKKRSHQKVVEEYSHGEWRRKRRSGKWQSGSVEVVVLGKKLVKLRCLRQQHCFGTWVVLRLGAGLSTTKYGDYDQLLLWFSHLLQPEHSPSESPHNYRAMDSASSIRKAELRAISGHV